MEKASYNVEPIGAKNALILLRYKASLMAERGQPVVIDIDDVNEVLTVANLPTVQKSTEEKA